MYESIVDVIRVCSEASDEKLHLAKIEAKVGVLAEKQAQLSSQLTKVSSPHCPRVFVSLSKRERKTDSQTPVEKLFSLS